MDSAPAHPVAPPPPSPASAGPHRAPVAAWVAVLLAALVYLVSLDRPLLQLPDEPREAEVARELWKGGLLRVPRVNDVLHAVKPPFAYASNVALFALEGKDPPSETAVRLPPALFTVATALVIAFVGRALHSPTLGLLAAAIFLLTPAVLSHGRRLVTDPALSFGVTVCVGAALLAQDASAGRRARLLLALSGLGAAWGFLAKGPVGVLVPAFALGAAIILQRGPLALLSTRALATAGAVALAVLPAVLLWGALLERDGALKPYIDYHTGGASGGTGLHKKAAWFYVVNAADNLLPWLIFPLLFLCPRAGPAAPPSLPDLERRAVARALLGWALGPFLLFSLLSQKREIYLLPLYPALSLLAALALLEARPAGGVLPGVRALTGLLRGAGWLGGTLGALGLAAYALHEGDSLLRVLPLLVAAGLAGLAIHLDRRATPPDGAPFPHVASTLAGAAALAIGLLVAVEPRTARAERTLRPVARTLAQAIGARTAPAKVYGYVLEEVVTGAIPYELGRTIPLLDGPAALAQTLAQEPDALVILRRLDHDALGRPGRVLAEGTGGRHHLLLVEGLRVPTGTARPAPKDDDG